MQIDRKHYAWLDLIRFLAAFAVLVCHYRGAFFVDFSSLPISQQTLGTKVFFLLTRLGHEAVLIFFVLSGFLVGGKVIERLTDSTFNPIQYIVDRTVRIMLPLLSSLLLFLPICFYYHEDVDLWIWIGNILSFQGILCPPVFETLWSLSYEVWFYILMGSLAVFLISEKRWEVWGAGFFLIISAFVFCKLKIYFLFIWMTGAMIYWRFPKKNRIVLYTSILAVIGGILLLELTSESQTENYSVTLIQREIMELGFGVIFAIMLIQVIQCIPRSKISVGIDRVGSYLASFSYTLYLTHIPVRILLVKLGAPKASELSLESIGLYILWIVIGMTIAWIMYLMFERNTRRVKKYIFKNFVRYQNENRFKQIQ